MSSDALPTTISTSSDSATTGTITSLNPLASRNANLTGPFLSPLYVTSSLFVSDDTTFDSWGFGPFINLHGGTLLVSSSSSWTTTRTVSVLSTGGTINSTNTTSLAATIGSGTLTSTGTGLLTIATPGHTGGTIVAGSSRLELLQGAPAHPGTITVNGGALNGEGAAGSISVQSGSIRPGATSSLNAAILHATDITLSPNATYFVDLNNTGGAGIGHDQLDAGSIALSDAFLQIRLNYVAAAGTQFTIANNVTGTFSGWAEGAFQNVSAGRFRITYQGGDGNDVVLTADDVPSASDRSADHRREPRPRSALAHGRRRPDPRRIAGRHGSSSNTAVVEDNDIVRDGGTARATSR